MLQKLMSRIIQDDSSGCWVWQRGMSRGYGTITVGGKTCYAHRIIYVLTYGDHIPDGWGVHHVCDNPACINPDHLIIGTDQENVEDKLSRGRQSYGEIHGPSKLTQEQAEDIRKIFWEDGVKQSDIARVYGVHQSQVSRIVHGRSWKCLQDSC